jgi:hypothetical protein
MPLDIVHQQLVYCKAGGSNTFVTVAGLGPAWWDICMVLMQAEQKPIVKLANECTLLFPTPRNGQLVTLAETIQGIYDQFDPDGAQGVQASLIARLVGVERTAMDQQDGGLVDDQQSFVLVQAAQGLDRGVAVSIVRSAGTAAARTIAAASATVLTIGVWSRDSGSMQ